MSTHRPAWLPDPEDPTQWRYWDGEEWTSHRSPRGLGGLPAAPTPAPQLAASEPTGNWYFIITLASFGSLAAVPFFHAASRLEKQSLTKLGVGFAVTSLVGYLLVGTGSTNAAGESTGFLSSVGSTIVMVEMAVACLLLIGIRRQVYDKVLIKAPSRNQGAMASVAEARRRREEARRIARTDPMMARELGIGRPSSNRYDDGGLLDLNLATAEELVTVAGLTPSAADGVVEARNAIGRFLSVEDAIVYGQVSEDETGLMRERGIVLRS